MSASCLPRANWSRVRSVWRAKTAHILSGRTWPTSCAQRAPRRGTQGSVRASTSWYPGRCSQVHRQFKYGSSCRVLLTCARAANAEDAKARLIANRVAEAVNRKGARYQARGQSLPNVISVRTLQRGATVASGTELQPGPATVLKVFAEEQVAAQQPSRKQPMLPPQLLHAGVSGRRSYSDCSLET